MVILGTFINLLSIRFLINYWINKVVKLKLRMNFHQFPAVLILKCYILRTVWPVRMKEIVLFIPVSVIYYLIFGSKFSWKDILCIMQSEISFKNKYRIPIWILFHSLNKIYVCILVLLQANKSKSITMFPIGYTCRRMPDLNICMNLQIIANKV